MKTIKRIICVGVVAGLSACQTEIPVAPYKNYQNYNDDYIYSVTYYGYRPYYWGAGDEANDGWTESDD